MKRTIGLLFFAAFVLCTAHGQTTVNATNQARPSDMLQLDPLLSSQQIEAMIRFQNDTVNRAFGLSPTVDGVLPRLLRAEQPWQLINPFAPPEYGVGAEILSVDLLPHPVTRRMGGISFFTFRF